MEDNQMWIDFYDRDTIFTIPNFIPGKYPCNKGKKFLMGCIYDVCIQDREIEPYYYALINNKKVVAIGEEFGYSGGLTGICLDEDFQEKVEKSKIHSLIQEYEIGNKTDWEEPVMKYCETYDELMELYKETKS